MNEEIFNMINKDGSPLTKGEYFLDRHYRSSFKEEYKNIVRTFKEENKKKIAFAFLTVTAKRYTIEFLKRIEQENKKDVPACPICGFRIEYMKKHIEKNHEMNWIDFVKKYDWKYGSYFYTKEHSEASRLSKKKYYNSEEGKVRKEKQSKMFSGDKNPACDYEVRIKISKSRTGQKASKETKEKFSKIYSSKFLDKKIASKTIGYDFKTIYNGKEIFFRSLAEYRVFYILRQNNIDFEYEPFRIQYYDENLKYNRYYILDMKIGQRLFEIKDVEVAFEKEKYKFVQKSLDKINKKLELLTPENIYSVLNINRVLTNSMLDDKILEEIKEGKCSVTYNKIYTKSPVFLKKLGNDWEKIIFDGEKKYEDSKNL